MAAQDISRHLFQPEKPYTGTRMQQGRVLLDCDINEAAMLDEEVQRALVVDVVGPHGSPDDGFKVTVEEEPESYDFDILAGSYYLGGYRHEIAGDPLSQPFTTQTEWLQSSRPDENPQPPAIPGATRHDLVYLVGWQHGVSAVEDAEFRELAIPGHDAGSRVRMRSRVRVHPGGPADCIDAFKALTAELEAGVHTFDFVNYELKSGVRLKVDVDDQTPTAADLCTPPVLQGFAGAQNHTIRVEVIGPRSFLWSVDNAAPLHRITVDADLQTITFVDPLPGDPANFAKAGQILEIVPWGAKLANGEKLADYPIADDIGNRVLGRVLTPYDPGDKTVTVDVDETGKLDNLRTWLNDQPGANKFMFARLWNPGDAGPQSGLGLTFMPGQPVVLPGTGLTVTFSEFGLVGDYWILAVRPSTPQLVVPWQLRSYDGAPPAGPRRFYSPLAQIHWSLNGVLDMTAEAEDCRRKFRPLTRLGGCCTFTVGDDITSFGDFSTVAAALAALPLDEPGRICLLPGVFAERIVLTLREDIVITGSGARTIVRTPAGNSTSNALILLDRCNNITLKNLRVEAQGQFGIIVLGTSTSQSRDITLENLEVATTRDSMAGAATYTAIPIGSSPSPLPTVAAYAALRLQVRRCKLNMAGDKSAHANVILRDCVASEIRDCKVITSTAGFARLAHGGVQLIGGSLISVADNEITDGLARGITLGSVHWSSAPGGYLGWFYPSGSVTMPEDVDCPTSGGGIPDELLIDAVALTLLPLHGPTMATIVRNHIHACGGSGISVLGFWGLDDDDELAAYKMIESHDLTIAENLIEDNYRAPEPKSPPAELIDVLAFGGIVLASADNLRIHDNVIRNNGSTFIWPTCGIYVLHGENIVIENNQILDNGNRVNGFTGYSGNRAGIALQWAGRRVTPGEAEAPVVDIERLLPAASVRGNIVRQPAGRALQIYGIGAFIVEGNYLATQGPGELLPPDLAGADCVLIQNLGQSPEILIDEIIPANVAIFPAPPLYYDPGAGIEEFLEGRTIFSNNQVRYLPAVGVATNIICATRIQSYGDIAVLDNQFCVTFRDGDDSHMFTDTIVVGWSIRVNNNRWEDPAVETTEFETDASANTLGVMNFTAFNQASRCIHYAASPSPIVVNNPYATNQILTDCVEPGFTGLLEPP